MERGRKRRAATEMRYLSLFSGCMGGDLGMQHLLGWECMGYVEINEYCQKIIRQRQEDGLIDRAPIFTDIRAFNLEYTREYQGVVDAITGGFPCQAFSSAASGKNISSKDLWPETSECIEIIQPDIFLGENTQRQAIEWAASSLYEMGYTSRGIHIAASDLGADHIRERYWILAYPYYKSELFSQINAEVARMPGVRPCVWETYPDESRMADGISNRVDRFEATGNAQLPIMASTAWSILSAGHLPGTSNEKKSK